MTKKVIDVTKKKKSKSNIDKLKSVMEDNPELVEKATDVLGDIITEKLTKKKTTKTTKKSSKSSKKDDNIDLSDVINIAEKILK